MFVYPERARKGLDRARMFLNGGNAAAAVGELEKVIAKVPKGPDAWLMLGRARSQMGDHRRALENFQRASQLDPGNPTAAFNLGVAHASLGQYAQAIQAYRHAVQCSGGNYPDALRNVAWCHLQAGEYELALQACEDHLRAFPSKAEVHALKGVAHQGLQDSAKAVEAYQQGFALGLNDPMMRLNLGASLHAIEDFQGAVENARLALQAMPNEQVARLNLGLAQVALGATREALATLAECALPEAQSGRLVALNYLDPFDIGRVVNEHKAWGLMTAAKFTALGVPVAEPAPAKGRKLRLGFLSADFRLHPVAYFFEGMLAQLDRSRFECILYFDAPNRDEVTERFRAMADEWVELYPIRDIDAAADRIRADRIDILFDTGGMTSARIEMFGMHMAPVQASYLGYGVTTGLPTMDYALTDVELDPQGVSDGHYSEKLIRLGSCFATYSPPVDVPPAALRVAQTPLLASVARLCKITDKTLGMWAGALQAVPGARLLVVAKGLQHGHTRQAFLQRCAVNGIAPERVELRGAVPIEDYFALHGEIDLLLDTLPWSGHTTTLHGLWMGVPTVTVEQSHHNGRFSVMVLRNAGLPEFIAPSVEEFGSHVAALLGNRDLLDTVRREGRSRVANSPLCDHAALARRFEAACTEMWDVASGERAPASDADRNRPAQAPGPAYRELLIGCGASREKRLSATNDPKWRGLVTLDNNPEHQPDVVWDLMNTDLPFDDDSFDELHAYEVLEHTGQQGDYRFFFAQFSDFWRILKPGGLLLATCPKYDSPWAWGDPSHTRIIGNESLTFLDQNEYEKQVGITAMSDFRYLYHADFQLLGLTEKDGSLQFILQAVKPSRIVPVEQRRCRRALRERRGPG